MFQLERGELRDHNVLVLLHLREGDCPKGGEHDLHVLCLEVRGLNDLLRESAARAPAFIAIMGTVISEANAKVWR